MAKSESGRLERFCRAYLRTMDPERAAAESGHRDGFALLGRKRIQERLEKMRSDAAGQLRRDDAVRRLAQLAFGRANDAVKLALHSGGTDPDQLDLSAVAEFKVTDKGVEVKFNDDGSLSLELHIGVDHGVNMAAVSRSIMNEVSYKLSKSTGVPVKNVDVYIDTIIG